ncbi:hypothetical protein FJV46_12495 [Arthrobacter agilis]|uniref:hypothetical protein n=1 Tax=Arthrobacter agilis TaxID=37921 RepID=UPI000B352FDE|nr:hypothetical protein [Arthrobacter agilis]OUM44587.1 hypothetical protein B8W74_03775 [Arthrobacter agilis]PPB47561.1 hypothetical protein CI784_01105 [Arthrobacter agilis]TPV22719.1 hypothetical protein FJV46_12495 [Arthrobacter agilis]VDR31960.1 Uncharacterised protein [Arthrobacter agilis]
MTESQKSDDTTIGLEAQQDAAEADGTTPEPAVPGYNDAAAPPADEADPVAHEGGQATDDASGVALPDEAPAGTAAPLTAAPVTGTDDAPAETTAPPLAAAPVTGTDDAPHGDDRPAARS